MFSGGLSVAEWETTGNSEPGTANPPTVEYTRGPDMGGGVGGLLYTSRRDASGSSPSALSPTLRYNLSNGRGDIVAQADSSAALTWTASYEAYGKRTKETGENLDKQRGNSKDEDPTGLLNEGFRYRDLETGVWLSRDPAGFVDGPNLYAYVVCNPWSKWDPDGLVGVGIVVDIGFLAWDLWTVCTAVSAAERGLAWANVGVDLVGLALDIGTAGTGGGMAYALAGRASLKADKIVDGAKAISKAQDQITAITHGVQAVNQAAKMADGTSGDDGSAVNKNDTADSAGGGKSDLVWFG